MPDSSIPANRAQLSKLIEQLLGPSNTGSSIERAFTSRRADRIAAMLEARAANGLGGVGGAASAAGGLMPWQPNFRTLGGSGPTSMPNWAYGTRGPGGPLSTIDASSSLATRAPIAASYGPGAGAGAATGLGDAAATAAGAAAPAAATGMGGLLAQLGAGARGFTQPGAFGALKATGLAGAGSVIGGQIAGNVAENVAGKGTAAGDIIGNAIKGAGIGAPIGLAGGPFAEISLPVAAGVGALGGAAYGAFNWLTGDSSQDTAKKQQTAVDKFSGILDKYQVPDTLKQQLMVQLSLAGEYGGEQGVQQMSQQLLPQLPALMQAQQQQDLAAMNQAKKQNFILGYIGQQQQAAQQQQGKQEQLVRDQFQQEKELQQIQSAYDNSRAIALQSMIGPLLKGSIENTQQTSDDAYNMQLKAADALSNPALAANFRSRAAETRDSNARQNQNSLSALSAAPNTAAQDFYKSMSNKFNNYMQTRQLAQLQQPTASAGDLNQLIALLFQGQ